ncbi:cupin domain-containing protein [Haloactinomyces albus]|uniref:cupin domain-containing protein n=1 Tax=Haloactinomyces albus TaxID=1352928 RepID=UPI0035B53283
MGSLVRTWGNDPAGSDCMLVGAYRSDGEVGRILREALPPYLVVHDPAPHITELLNLEIVRDEVGQGGVLDRLLDLLLIATLRKWLGRRARAIRGCPPAEIRRCTVQSS